MMSEGVDPLLIALICVGSLTVARTVFKVAVAWYKLFLRGPKKLANFGKWAVVTGATDGIGKAYALGLAKKGLSIVLISRTEAKLKVVKEEIEAKYPGVEVKYVVCDYSNFNQAAKDHVKSFIEGLDVGVLINNVGVSYKFPLFFHELSDDDVGNIVEMNVNSTIWMTRFVIDKMIEKRKGAILNISSGSAMYSLPLLAEYSAVKSLIEKFSRGLNAEYKSKGIFVQCQIPFFITTKLAKIRHSSLTVPTPAKYVSCGINWIGHDDPVASPFWAHAFMGAVLDHLPEVLRTKIMMNEHLGLRKRGFKKEARLAAEKKD